MAFNIDNTIAERKLNARKNAQKREKKNKRDWKDWIDKEAIKMGSIQSSRASRTHGSLYHF